jgi:hypothetical protein
MSIFSRTVFHPFTLVRNGEAANRSQLSRSLDQAENEECRFDENGVCAFGCERAEYVHVPFHVERVETPHVSRQHRRLLGNVKGRRSVIEYHVRRHHASPREASIDESKNPSIRSRRFRIASTSCVMNAYISYELRISREVSRHSSSLSSVDLGANYLNGFIDIE